MSKPQSLFSKEGEEALDAMIKKLKARRDNPEPMTLGLSDDVLIVPPPIACDFWDNALTDEGYEAFLNRRFAEGYHLKDGKWGL